MIFKILPCLLSFVLVWAGPVSVAAASEALVYKVSPKEGGGAPLYLAGSIHLLRASDYPLPPPYEDAYTASERVVFEILQDEKDAPSQMDMLAKGTLPDGETLADHIDPATYKKLGAYLKEAGIPKAGMDRFRPWLVALTISVMEYMKQGAEPERGMDLFFEKRAKEDKKLTRGLETMEFQIGLFTGLSAGEQEEMLQQTLDEIDEMEERVKELFTAWSEGDEETLAATLLEDLEIYKDIYEELIFERNRNWVAPIKAMLADGTPTMVVVGAGHLVGEGSVVDLLRKEGFTVEQVSYPGTGDGGQHDRER